jgi:8-oxo-dGTP diphosphatase
MSEGRVRIAAYALCQDDAGRVLLCHIAPSVGVGDVWTLPGGGLGFGEAPAVAVIRELAEETGYIGEVDTLLDVSDRLFGGSGGSDGASAPGVPPERMHAIRIVYAVRITGGALRDEPDGSTDTCRWLTIQETTGLHLGELARREIARLHVRAGETLG